MNIPAAVTERLAKMQRNKLWLAEKSGVAKTPIYNFMKGDSDMTIGNLQTLATKGLGIKLSTLIKEAEGK
jgi:hypothetical protein